MRIAVIGGGINGLCTAWQLAQEGHKVSLFERDELMHGTSRASSKLLHGGLRYLEQGHLRLVRESLHERRWWLRQAPKLTRRLPILYPIYRDGQRPRWQLKLGLSLYDLLAGRAGLGRHRWLNAQRALRCSPQLKAEGLRGAYLFFDGQMDDYQLGLWMAGQCRTAGVEIHEHSEVRALDLDGRVQLGESWHSFDQVINVSGPWSEQLLQNSHISPPQKLDLVRGSHLLLPAVSRYGHMLEVPDSNRIMFVLPYQNQSLVGTTEVRQNLDEPVICSDAERDQLLAIYNHYFQIPRSPEQVLGQFAGLRPLLAGTEEASKASRDYRLHWQGRVLSVFGGKWTTARALGERVAREVKRRG